MNRTLLPVDDADTFKRKALKWACQFNTCILLDSNYQHNKNTQIEWLLVVDALDSVCAQAGNAFPSLDQFIAGKTSLMAGFLAYDLKNEVEHLESKKTDPLGFPHMFFFEPRYILELKDSKVSINRNYPESYEILDAITQIQEEAFIQEPVTFYLRTGKEPYLKNIESIRQQIIEGDFYELNYCIEQFAEAKINPVDTFLRLNKLARAPFSCFAKYGNKYLLCASPERFLKKTGTQLLAQPMKGTVSRSADHAENAMLIERLKNSEKERAENLMITNLMRNDLAKSCVTGSIVAEEICEVYEFATANQMISSVRGKCRSDVSIAEIIRNAFPMGSMTGAPKVEVMKAIEHYEDFARNLFSGSVGYITPDGDFDFNVVIRSIFYCTDNHYLSLRAGSAITYDSIGEDEWNEVMLKMQAMKDVLSN